MDPSHASTPVDDNKANPPPSARSTPSKRPSSTDDGPPSKKIKATVEVPQLYSDAVRKKLAATSRTGQACDRCSESFLTLLISARGRQLTKCAEERKMKCDTDPIACQPCRQKNLRCYTTDRVTGQARERGQSNRVENELQFLREQNAAYERKHGPLQPGDMQQTQLAEPGQSASSTSSEPGKKSFGLPSSQYVGWPAPDHSDPLHHGPVNGTEVDILDGVIDIADFECEMMQEYPPSQLGIFNVSRTSITNTTTGYQTVIDPKFPSKEEALLAVNTFLIVMNQYAPILHRQSFIKVVNRIYDPQQEAKLSEQVQLAMVLCMVTFQTATRNHNEAAEKFERSHHWLHYALTWYRELIRERSLASMQALALVLLHLRTTPKPGYSWSFGHNLIMKVIELDYHRDPDKIELPPSENNPLAKELRKRVFHAILGVCVTTGCRVNKPAPWQFQHMDVSLPAALPDSELTEGGIGPSTGKCDFWPCLQLAKLLPLLIEMYNFVTVVRRPEAEYVKIVEILHGKLDAWRRDWDKSIEKEENHVNLKVATLFMETWAAEYILNLYHPSLCPSRSPEVMERHLDICHRQAQRLLRSFHTLSQRYKGVDFTWHTTAAYAMGFGVTLYIYSRRIARVASEQFEVMRNELKGWMSLMAYADLVMRTGNHLQHIFEPRVKRLESRYRELLLVPTGDARGQRDTLSGVNGAPNHTANKSEPSPGAARPTGLSETNPPAGLQQADHGPMFSTHQTSSNWPAMFVSAPTTSAYASYSSHSGPYPTATTSLAPVLNDSSTAYMNYPSTSAVPNDWMMFSPTHYSGGHTSWPFITLPQGDENFEHNTG